MISFWKRLFSRKKKPRFEDLLQAGDLEGLLGIYAKLPREQHNIATEVLVQGGAKLVPAIGRELLKGEWCMVGLLDEIGGDEAEAFLFESLAIEDNWRVGCVVASLLKSQPAQSNKFFLRLVEYPRPSVRLAALEALDEDVPQALLDAALEDENEEIREFALFNGGRPSLTPRSEEALRAVGEHGDVSTLLAALESEAPSEALLFGMIDRNLDGCEVLQAPLTRLAYGSPDLVVSDRAALLLAKLGVSVSVERLLLALGRQDTWDKADIALVLSTYPGAAGYLLDAFEADPCWEIASALAQTPGDEALWGLIGALRNPRQRQVAALALRDRGDPIALDYLRDVFPYADTQRDRDGYSEQVSIEMAISKLGG